MDLKIYEGRDSAKIELDGKIIEDVIFYDLKHEGKTTPILELKIAILGEITVEL